MNGRDRPQVMGIEERPRWAMEMFDIQRRLSDGQWRCLIRRGGVEMVRRERRMV